MSEQKLRRCEVLIVEDNTWVVIPFGELKKGDIFRLFDSTEDLPKEVDGKPYKPEVGNPCIALDDAYLPEGMDIYAVRCDPYVAEGDKKEDATS
jgi:hypothetical protein